MASAILLNNKYFHFGAEVEPAIPKAPSELTVIDSGDKKITHLQWTDNATNESGFKIERKDKIENSFQEVASLGVNVVSYSDTSITEGKRYYYRLKAYNSLGSSIYSEIGTPTRQEQFNLLTGIGDFERYHSNDIGQEVADGWSFSGSVTSADKTMAIKESGTGIDGSNRQKIGIKNITSGNHWVYLYRIYKVGSVVQFGDTVTFKTDQIHLFDNTNIPAGASLLYVMRIRLQYGTYNTWPTYYFNQNSNSGTINFTIPQASDVPEALRNNFELTFEFMVMASGNIGTLEPALSIDGASIFVSRSGASLEVEVPAPRNRMINTQITFYYQDTEPYEIATKYDGIMAAIADDNSIYNVIRYYNPNIKIYAYVIPGVIQDFRTPDFTDPTNPELADRLGFADVIQNHLDWLYTYEAGYEPFNDRREDFPLPDKDRTYKKCQNNGFDAANNTCYAGQYLNFIFDADYQDNYYIHMDNSLYQEAWKEKVKNALVDDYFDGIFIDALNIAQEPARKIGTSTDCSDVNDPNYKPNCKMFVNRMPYEVQNFIHNTASFFKENQLETMSNQIGQYLQRFIGRSYYDPYWNPNTESNPEDVYGNSFDSNQYTQNTPDNTYDNIFVEHAYMTFWWVKDPATNNFTNRYDLNLWKDSIVNLELVNQWNQTLPEGKKKKIWHLVYNVDCKNCTAVDPMEGQDGWARFGLTSYLLSNNEYSYLGISRREPYNDFGNSWFFPYDPGYNLTSKLGNPAENRIIHSNYPDQSLQSRQFENGLVVVNGSPDEERVFHLTSDMIDEAGTKIAAGDLVLPNHSGRIFFTAPTPTPTPGKSPTSKPSPTPTPTPTPTVIPSPTPNPTDEQTSLPPDDQSSPPTETPPLAYQTPTSPTQNTSFPSLPRFSPTPARSDENGIRAPEQQSSPTTTTVASKKSKYITWILVILGFVIALEVIFILIKSRKEKL